MARRPWHRDPDGFEQATRADLQQRRWLRLHVLLLAALTTALCWGVSALLRQAGVTSLAWRPLAAVLLTWPLYLGLLWAWGRWLLSDHEANLSDALDGADLLDGAGQLVADGAQAAARGLAHCCTTGCPRPAPCPRRCACCWAEQDLARQSPGRHCRAGSAATRGRSFAHGRPSPLGWRVFAR